MQSLRVVGAENARRNRCERFIRQSYDHHFRAEPDALPRKILSVADESGEIVGAVGLRSAADGFFSESYLESPIDRLLTAIAGRAVSRNQIVEVAGLAIRSPCILPAFLEAVVRHCEDEGFDWAFFTLTHNLAVILQRLKLGLVRLGSAERHRVARPEAWGSYYDRAPAVFAVERGRAAVAWPPRRLGGAGDARAL